MYRVLRTGLAVVLLVSLFPESSRSSASGLSSEKRYRHLIQERDRLVKRNRFLAAELTLAQSNAFYLVMHTAPPGIQLKAQATLLKEYAVQGLHIDRALRNQLKINGVIQWGLHSFHGLPPDTSLAVLRASEKTLTVPGDSLFQLPTEAPSTAPRDSVASEIRVLYVIELDPYTTIWVQSGVEKGGLGSFFRHIKQWLVDEWDQRFSHRRTVRMLMDKHEAVSLLGTLETGMDFLFAE